MACLVDVTGFLPRITIRDGRAIEQALAGQTLFQPGVELGGAVVEASFARDDPPLLRRLSDRGVPRLIDPQTLRFATDTFLEIEAFARLPYAPSACIEPAWLRGDAGDEFVAGVLDFEHRHGATDYLSPPIPVFDHDLEQWVEAHEHVLRASTRANGIGGLPRKPLIASLAPGPKARLDPSLLIDGLHDLPLDGIYVQPLLLAPTRDSVDKLVNYIRFLLAAQQIGIPVIAGRVGAFGLILEALGIAMFDSGLGQAEGFNLTELNKRRPARADSSDAPKGSRRIYLRALKTTLPSNMVEKILSERGLRSHFGCELACCQWRDQQELGGRCREHYLRVRQDEVAQVERRPTSAMRLSELHDDLVASRELGLVVSRTLRDRGHEPPRFDHLDRWLAVIATVTDVSVAA